MLGLRDDGFFIFFGLVFSFVALIVSMNLRHKERKERMALARRALEQGNLDDATRQHLLQAVPPHARRGYLLRNPVFTIGWLGLFLGGGLLMTGERDTFEAGIVVALVSFGIVTMPFALRELEGRKHA
jgi:hypothetical protein